MLDYLDTITPDAFSCVEPCLKTQHKNLCLRTNGKLSSQWKSQQQISGSLKSPSCQQVVCNVPAGNLSADNRQTWTSVELGKFILRKILMSS